MKANTLHEIRIRGFRVLVQTLGPADAIRGIQSYTHGSGDYPKGRKAWQKKDFDTVVAGYHGAGSHSGRSSVESVHQDFWGRRRFLYLVMEGIR